MSREVEIREREQEIRDLVSEDKWTTDREQALERVYPKAHPGLRWVLALRFLLSEIDRLRRVERAAEVFSHPEGECAFDINGNPYTIEDCPGCDLRNALSNTLELPTTDPVREGK